MKNKIAIIGAGFSGLATAWHLLQSSHLQVEIFDPLGPGGGTSGIASGLLHPFVGAFSNLNWQGFNGIQATNQLLEVSSTVLGVPVASQTGMLRIALTPLQVEKFKRCAEKYPENVGWMDRIEISGIQAAPGIFIKNAQVVNCRSYLKGLWIACEKLGAYFHYTSVKSLNELKDYRGIVIATGAEAHSFSETKRLEINPVKGQILEFASNGRLPFQFPLNSQAYLIQETETSLIGGATYEKRFSSLEPNPDFAIKELIPKIAHYFPAIKEMKITGCRAGARASTPDHLPIIKEVKKNCWVLSGMGSKGLLYHALFARELAQRITPPLA